MDIISLSDFIESLGITPENKKPFDLFYDITISYIGGPEELYDVKIFDAISRVGRRVIPRKDHQFYSGKFVCHNDLIYTIEVCKFESGRLYLKLV